MDIKLKKFKYSIPAKLLCLVLALVALVVSLSSAASFIVSGITYGFDNYTGKTTVSFNEIPSFTRMLSDNTEKLCSISDTLSGYKQAEMDAQEANSVKKAVNDYLDKKVNIIKSELIYAVEHYDSSYVVYEDSADGIYVPVTDYNPSVNNDKNYTSASIDGNNTQGNEYTVPADAPKNIQTAAKVLNNVSGRSFLKYTSLVREDAFSQEYSSEQNVSDAQGNFLLTVSYYADNYNFSEENITKMFTDIYEKEESLLFSNYTYSISYNSDILNNVGDMYYYIVSDTGNIQTNIAEAFDTNSITKHQVYAYNNGTDTVLKGVGNDKTISDIKEMLKHVSGCKIYFYIDYSGEQSNPSGVYAKMFNFYSNNTKTASKNITVFAISFIAFLLLFIVLINNCGKTNDYDGIKLAFIDKLPTDIHSVISFGLMLSVFIIAPIALTNKYYNIYDLFYLVYSSTFKRLCITSAIIYMLIFIEWLTSTVRIKKAGNSWLKRCITVKFILFISHSIKKLVSSLAYKPRKMKKTAIILSAMYFLLNMILCLMISSASDVLGPIILLFLILSLNIGYVIFILNYIIDIDKIIEASSEHREVEFGNRKVPTSLQTLAENLTNTNDELKKAVDEAVRNEQIKTELITNVSHDLKTPLTSLITYSDILKKCKIDDPMAQKYVSVINEQSIKLKRLIEDLIEASKVSTGNVTLNKTTLNLSELTAQAIAEFSPEMEQNGNEIIFNEPEEPPFVFADGTKTYRIFSNLLSNAKKYSASGTRVYISINTDGEYGYFEIKNVSSEPLNINADTLTERFVRGDKSRANEGNGLGLSIAKDLCLLQNGELQLIIDGDLFKAIVKLPTHGNADELQTDETPTATQAENNPET